ncbi:hypothetical protein FOZ63_003215, partial [Perkinsus olseni]
MTETLTSDCANTMIVSRSPGDDLPEIIPTACGLYETEDCFMEKRLPSRFGVRISAATGRVCGVRKCGALDILWNGSETAGCKTVRVDETQFEDGSPNSGSRSLVGLGQPASAAWPTRPKVASYHDGTIIFIIEDVVEGPTATAVGDKVLTGAREIGLLLWCRHINNV